jgi:hypothetical protein
MLPHSDDPPLHRRQAVKRKGASYPSCASHYFDRCSNKEPFEGLLLFRDNNSHPRRLLTINVYLVFNPYKVD